MSRPGYTGKIREAKSCIVKFRHHEVNKRAVEAALHYVHVKIHKQHLNLGSVYGVDCDGAVPAAAVVYVDEIDISDRGNQTPANTRQHASTPGSGMLIRLTAMRVTL